MKVVGTDLELDAVAARYIIACGKDMDLPSVTLSLKETAGLLLSLKERSVLVFCTEN